MTIKNLSFSFLALSLVVFAIACGRWGKEALSAQKAFGDEIQLKQNLVFTFNKNVVSDSLTGAWRDEELVKIDPPVKGKFKWTASNELIFSPDQGFEPSTDYKAELTEEINKNATEKVSLGENMTFAFHTPYLNLVGSDIYWAMGKQNTPEVRINLNFNYPVSPADVEKLAKVMVDNQEVKPSVNASGNSEMVQIVVPQAAGNFDAKPLLIKLAKGLKMPNSNYEATEMQIETAVPSKDDFSILQAFADYGDEKPIIKILTNQGIGNSESEIKEKISLVPAVEFSVEKLEAGFVIKGNFANEEVYKVLINKSLRGIFNAELGTDTEQYVSFGKATPSIKFASKKGGYLTSKGAKQIAVRISEVAEVNLSVYKVYENNILHFLRSNYSSYYDENGGENYYLGSIANFGDLIYEQKIETKTLRKVDGNMRLIDLSQINDNQPFKGFYVVQVSSDNDRYLQDARMVSISDLGFIVKETPNEILVFTNSILTAEPLKDVNVSLVSQSNQNVLQAKTDEKGVARFPNIRDKDKKLSIQMISGSLGSDFNFLFFEQNQVEVSRYNVGGVTDNETSMQAFIYAERNLYRPDETVKIKTVVRDLVWNSVGEIPIKVKMTLPNGKDFDTKKGLLNKQGTFETQFKLPNNAVTGTYTVEVYSSADILLNSYYVSIEEFTPQRIKVLAKTDKETYAENDAKITLKAQAQNLFGTPAANRNYEVDFNLQAQSKNFAGFEDYTFQISGRNDLVFQNDFRNERQTDGEGNIEEEFNIPEKAQNVGILDGKIYTTVFDETGRPVTKTAYFEVVTQPYLLGIKNFDYYVGLRQALNIPIVALSPDGKPAASAKARLRIIKYEWQNVLEKDYNGAYRYVSQRRERVLKDQEMTVNGKSTTFPFIPNASGEYEVRVSLPNEERSYVGYGFYAYGWGSTDNGSFEVDKEGQVKIELNQAKYQVGETAKVLFTTPFKGKLLVTLERNSVVEYFVLNTDNKSASLDIPIKKEHLPNVYIAATLIKPVDDSSIPLTVAHGYQPLIVEDTKMHAIPLKIKAIEKSRSNTKQEITVISDKKNSDIEITIAAVDEGILLMKDYQNPDPLGFFFQKRALQVNSYDLYPRLFPEFKGMKNSFGADSYDLGKRTNPLSNKRVKPVSFWSGTLKTDGNGEAKYTIDIPQFSGDLRIMAVAVKDNAFGAASTNMKVADPVVLSSALPMFLSPLDEADVPVTLSNTTDKPINVETKISIEGTVLQVSGNSKETIAIPANGEKQVFFKILAQNQIGNAKVKVEATANGEKFKQETEMTVRPSTSLLKTSGSGSVAANSSQKVDLKAGFLESSIEAKLIVSKSPLVGLAKEMQYLVQYPYGCVEQTISTAFPQLYLAELLKSLENKSDANFNVKEALAKLQSMQLYSGALSYWQGGDEESWWGSVYAAHFVLEAQKAGFEVNKTFQNSLTSYISNKAKQKSTFQYSYYDNENKRIAGVYASKEIFYSLYVLALTGKPDMATMNYYKANQKLLTLDSKYLLGTSYFLVGDKVSYQKLIPTAFSGEKSEKAFGGSFYSYVRDQAISLNALLDADPKNAQIPTLARQLSQEMKRNPYMNTQETAFSLLALGKIAKKANATNVTAEITANGQKIGSFNGTDLVLKKEVAGKNLEIRAQGTGELYYFWEMEGLNATGEYVEEDKFLKVRKTFFDRFGRPISADSFTQNDLIVIRIDLQSDKTWVENVVITDMLPAGWEIENPRIGAGAGMDWVKNAATPTHFDFRDDRVNIFTSATPEGKSYYYVVRAVSKGKFRMGPVSADAMYNGEYHSYNGAGTVTVQ